MGIGPTRARLGLLSLLAGAAFFAFAGTAAAASPTIESESISHLTPTGATLEAQIDPQGAADGVFVQFQLLHDPGEALTELICPASPPAGYSACVGPQDPGALPLEWVPGDAVKQVDLNLADRGLALNPGRTYYFRVLAADAQLSEDAAEWEKPAVVGESVQLTTPDPPSLLSESVSNVTSTDATLEAQIEPNGNTTTFRFEIAKAPACLPVKAPFTPCAKVEVGNLPEGSRPPTPALQAVSLDLASVGIALQPGTKYHYRAVASADDETVEGASQDFTTTTGSPACLDSSGDCGPPPRPPVACKKRHVKRHGRCVRRQRHRHHGHHRRRS